MLLKLTVRHMKLFYRDRTAVFFSLLSSIILIGLYALFLGDVFIYSMTSQGVSEEVATVVISSWLIAGLVAVNAFNIPLSMLSIYIEDREKEIVNDFYSAPISRTKLLLSYLCSALIMGLIFVLVTVVAGQAYLFFIGGNMLSVTEMITLLGVLIISVIAFLSFDLLIISFIKTQKSLAVIETMAGTFIGFIAGIYIPIGNLSKGIQNALSFVPITQSASLIRKIYMSPSIASLESIVPKSAAESIFDSLGVNLYIGDFSLSNGFILVYLLAFTILCLGIGSYRISKQTID